MKNLARLTLFAPSALLFAPLLAFAQDLAYFDVSIQGISILINSFLIPIVFAVAGLVFFWGVFTYFILGADNEEKRATGRSYMLYAIIGFVFMVALWGVVQLVTQIFGFNQDQDVQLVPNAPTTNL